MLTRVYNYNIIVAGEKEMKKILNKVMNHEISINDAYNSIYGPKDKRARFISIKIDIAKSKGVSRFINTLFLLPIPLFIGKIFLKKYLKESGITKELYKELVRTAGGTNIIVDNDEVNVRIKIF